LGEFFKSKRYALRGRDKIIAASCQ